MSSIQVQNCYSSTDQQHGFRVEPVTIINLTRCHRNCGDILDQNLLYTTNTSFMHSDKLKSRDLVNHSLLRDSRPTVYGGYSLYAHLPRH
jgi:hypothetical protein